MPFNRLPRLGPRCDASWRCRVPAGGSGCRARGLGLVEALVVLALIATLAAAVLPGLRDAVDLRRLRTASAQWASLIHAARHWAFTLHRPVRLEFQSGPRACLLLHTGPRGACIGCTATDCREGAQLLASTPVLGAELVASASSTSMLWSPADRTVTPTGTITLALADGRALHHVVNLVGRMRLCSPGGLVTGVAAC